MSSPPSPEPDVKLETASPLNQAGDSESVEKAKSSSEMETSNKNKCGAVGEDKKETKNPPAGDNAEKQSEITGKKPEGAKSFDELGEDDVVSNTSLLTYRAFHPAELFL